MFKLRRTCKTCPFRKDQGRNFGLNPDRLIEIIEATAFQCHSTVDYDEEVQVDEEEGGWDETWRPVKTDDNAQQCAGLMSLLHRAGRPNTIMQVAERLDRFDPSKLNHEGIYDSLADMMCDHTGEAREVVEQRLSQLR